MVWDSWLTEGEVSDGASGSNPGWEVLGGGAGGETFGEKVKGCEELDIGREVTGVVWDSLEETAGSGVNTEDFVG